MFGLIHDFLIFLGDQESMYTTKIDCLQRKYQETCCTAKLPRWTRKVAWTFADHGGGKPLKVMFGRVR